MLDCIKNYDELNIEPKYSEKEYETGYFSKEVSLGNGFKNIEIHLPYSVKLTLYKMELDENAVIEPIKYKKILLAYGTNDLGNYNQFDFRRNCRKFFQNL